MTNLQHIAFIMDGNGRWAEKRGKKRSDGHKAGAQTMQDIVNCCFDMGIRYVTVYALSTENFKNRPKQEIKELFELIRQHLKSSSSQFKKLINSGIRIEFLGDLTKLDEDILDTIRQVRYDTRHCNCGQLNIAINYGARDELVQAINLCVDAKLRVNEESFKKYLYTKDIADPDLIVRSGGDMRLSNFLLFQAAYSELYFTKTLWPDFDKQELQKVVKDFEARRRKFGGV